MQTASPCVFKLIKPGFIISRRDQDIPYPREASERKRKKHGGSETKTAAGDPRLFWSCQSGFDSRKGILLTWGTTSVISVVWVFLELLLELAFGFSFLYIPILSSFVLVVREREQLRITFRTTSFREL